MSKKKTASETFQAMHEKNSVQNKINSAVFSFSENEIPKEISSVDSKISISKRHYAKENSCLRWDCKKGSKLLIEYVCDDLENTYETQSGPTGKLYKIYNGAKAFSMYAYSEEKTNNSFCVRFHKKGEAVSEFRFITNFVGWREMNVPFNADMMRCDYIDGFDNITIIAEDEKSTIYIDRLSPCMNLDARMTRQRTYLPLNKYSPARRLNNFKNNYTDNKNIPLNSKTGTMTKDDAELIKKNYLKYAKSMDMGTDRNFQEVVEEFETFNIKEVEGCITGILLGTLESGKINKICSDLAYLYLNSEDETEKSKIAETAVLAIRHSIDHSYNVDWYNGRGLATGVLIFKDYLKESGYFDLVFDFLWEGYELDRIYDLTTNAGFHNATGEDTDTTGTCISSYIAIFLSRDSLDEMARDFSYFKKYLETRTLQPCDYLNGYLPDGTAAHHATFLLEYYQTANNGMANVFAVLSKTKFALSEQSYEFFKNIIRVENIWRSGYHQPLALAHKKLSTEPGLRSDYIGKLALACENGVDTELAGQYLYQADFHQKDKESSIYKELLEMNMAPQKPKDGHCTISFSALAAHKIGDITAYVKGHSKYSFVMETWYTQVCAFPYYRSFGILEFCKDNSSFESEADNGIKLDEGFDWRHYPGTTTVKLPFDKLKTQVFRIGDEFNETIRSDQEFVGGVDDGKNGIFAIKLRGHSKYGIADFFATKTYFFYENMVVCLGSNIEKFSKTHNVTTTILQNSTENNELVKGDNYLLDSRNIGYYLEDESMEKLVSSVEIQKTPNSGDTEICEGHYELAFIDHGLNPYEDTYRYSVHLNSTKEKMENLEKNMNSSNPIYKVVQQDKYAHIVEIENKIDMLVVFEKDYNLQNDIVSGVNFGCLIIVDKSKSDEIKISIADPDLRFYEGEVNDKDYLSQRRDMSNYEHQWRTNSSIPSTIYIRLNGKIDNVMAINGDFKIIHQDENHAVVETVCRNGLTNSFKI